MRRGVQRAAVFLAYATMAVVFTFPLFTARGVVSGGDWDVPVTATQIARQASSGMYLWTNFQNLFGVSQNYLALPITTFFWIAGSVGFDGAILSRFLLICTFAICGYAVFAYALRLGIRRDVSFFAGVLFMTSPVVFDYSAFGWQFVLIGFALMPFSLMRFEVAIESPSLLKTFAIGLIYSMAVALATQNLVWYPLGFLLLAGTFVRSTRQMKNAAVTILGAGLVVVLLNLSWLIPFALNPDPYLVSTASASEAPVGQRLNNLDLLRLWGSLFNYQFETAFPRELVLVTFFLPLLAWGTILFGKKQKHLPFLTAMALVPFIVYSLRGTIYDLPLSIVVRDLSRFTLFSTFGYVLLGAFALQRIVDGDWSLPQGPAMARPRSAKPLAGLVVILLLVNATPFWTGELVGTPKQGNDIRLRALDYPIDALLVERNLSAEPESVKALFLPIGGLVNVARDHRFDEIYEETSDVFAHFSPVPGSIYDNDRRSGAYREVAGVMASENLTRTDFEKSELLSLLGVKFVVIRNDFRRGPNSPEASAAAFRSDPDLRVVSDSGLIEVLENTKRLPHVYLAKTLIRVEGSPAEQLLNATWQNVTSRKGVIIFSTQVTENTSVAFDAVGENQSEAHLKFEKVNPTKYEVLVENQSEPFLLVFSETFDPRWVLVADDSISVFEGPEADSSLGGVEEAGAVDRFQLEDLVPPTESNLVIAHFVANGYANGWVVDPRGASSGQLQLTLVFAPQAYVYVGTMVFGGVILAYAIIALADYRARRAQSG